MIRALALLAEVMATVAVLAGLARPAHRLWPPAQAGARSGRWMSFLFGVSGAGIIVLGAAGWGSLALPRWIRWAIGRPLWAAGNGLALWAMATLGGRRTVGGEGTLVCRGPYRLSRHPQYTGFIAGLIGWSLMSASSMALAPSLAGVVPLLLASVAEDRWLAEHHGAAYEAYRRSTPRFLPFRRARGNPARR